MFAWGSAKLLSKHCRKRLNTALLFVFFLRCIHTQNIATLWPKPFDGPDLISWFPPCVPSSCNHVLFRALAYASSPSLIVKPLLSECPRLYISLYISRTEPDQSGFGFHESNAGICSTLLQKLCVKLGIALGQHVGHNLILRQWE